MGDGLGIAGAPEDPVCASRRHAGKEVLQVESDDDPLSNVPSCVREDRMAAPESLCVFVRRDAIEYLMQHPALEFLQVPLRRLDQPRHAVVTR